MQRANWRVSWGLIMTNIAPALTPYVLKSGDLPKRARLCTSISADAPQPDMVQRGAEPVAVYEYHNADSTLACLVARYQDADSKRFCPFTVWHTDDGLSHWVMKGLENDRPLYRYLPLLAETQKPVLLVEGEKCADAARALSAYVSVSWMGGSNAIDKTDFSALKSRDVILLPDDDAPGEKATEALIKALKHHHVSRLRVFNSTRLAQKMASRTGAGFDIADAIDAGLTEPQFAAFLGQEEMIEEITLFENQIEKELWERFHFRLELPEVFRMTDDGIIKIELNPTTGMPSEIFAGSAMAVLGRTRQAGMRGGWGYQVAVRTPDGEWVCKTISARLLAGDGREMREIMADEGFVVPQQLAGRRALGEYIAYAQDCQVIHAADRPGWHGGSFALPDSILTPKTNETPLVLDMGDRQHFLAVGGTMDGWQELAKLAAQSSRATFVICVALAAPLLRILEIEGCGYHLFGESSRSKTTNLILAGSVWGGGGKDGFVRSWRTTNNGAEALVADHNDLLLPLDELTLAAPEAIAEMLYMLTNGHGKSRAKEDGRLAKGQQWLAMMLSSGEHPTSRILDQGRGRSRMTGGIAVRMVDIPITTENGTSFEQHAPFATAGAFADQIKSLAKTHYGHAGRAFVQEILCDRDAVKIEAQAHISSLLDHLLEADDDPQVQRVAKSFGTVAAAGHIAADRGILPMSKDQITNAISTVFTAWKTHRGGGESEERRNARRHLKYFFEANGAARFERLVRGNVPDDEVRGEDRNVRDRCGYRVEQEDGAWLYYVLPEAWDREVCGHHAPDLVARIALESTALLPGEGRHRQKNVRLPDYPGTTRVYAIRPDLLP